jgi:hypothetical protein
MMTTEIKTKIFTPKKGINRFKTRPINNITILINKQTNVPHGAGKIIIKLITVMT